MIYFLHTILNQFLEKNVSKNIVPGNRKIDKKWQVWKWLFFKEIEG